MKAKAPKWTVVVLWIFAALDIVNGIEMFFFPAAWFFRLVPGVTETGPFNAHLVMDGGTFFLAVGIGLGAPVLDPRRHAAAVLVAAVAGTMPSVRPLFSPVAGVLPFDHFVTQRLGIHLT